MFILLTLRRCTEVLPACDSRIPGFVQSKGIGFSSDIYPAKFKRFFSERPELHGSLFQRDSGIKPHELVDPAGMEIVVDR